MGTKIGYNTIAMVVLLIIMITLLTIVFCYAHIIKIIRNVKEDNRTIKIRIIIWSILAILKKELL